MRSRRGIVAASVLLLAFPATVLYQVLMGSGAGTVIHLGLGLGALLAALAVFDFNTPRWATWLGCISMLILGIVFLLQAVSEITHHEAITYIAYQVLGTWGEALPREGFTIWLMALLLTDSQGRTRIMGLAAMAIVLCLTVYSYVLMLAGTSVNAENAALTLVYLVAFVWLLLESAKRRQQLSSSQTGDDGRIGHFVGGHAVG
jgi:hypothetical protein